MTATSYDPASTLFDARRAYFEANSFGANGGYDEAWVDFKIGPIPMPFPNTAARIAAVKVHDLHHIVTGYATDLAGEMEIAGWEIGAGCGRFAAAWVLNLSGVAFGTWVWPKRVFRAFVRGRRSRSLYGRPLDELLPTTVGEVRAQTGVDRTDEPASAVDAILYAIAFCAGSVIGSSFFLLALPLMPLGVLALSVARRRQEA